MVSPAPKGGKAFSPDLRRIRAPVPKIPALGRWMNRREFLTATASTAALAGLFPRVALGQMRLPPGSVRWGTGLEPLVKVIEDTPREKLLEEIASRVRKGLAYNELLAALFVAAVRNV